MSEFFPDDFGKKKDDSDSVDSDTVDQTDDDTSSETTVDESVPEQTDQDTESEVEPDNPNAMNYVPQNEEKDYDEVNPAIAGLTPEEYAKSLEERRDFLPKTSTTFENAHEVIKGDSRVDGPYLDEIRAAEQHKYREARTEQLNRVAELSPTEDDLSEEEAAEQKEKEAAAKVAGETKSPAGELLTKNQGDDKNYYGDPLTEVPIHPDNVPLTLRQPEHQIKTQEEAQEEAEENARRADAEQESNDNDNAGESRSDDQSFTEFISGDNGDSSSA